MSTYNPHFYTNATPSQMNARDEIARLSHMLELPEAERRRLSPMFMHSGQTARLLAMYQVYEQILTSPGVILDFGTWRGQTAVACEHFRSILEPLNATRRIYAFDTFEGYAGFGSDDKGSGTVHNGAYATGKAYSATLQYLLDLQYQASAMTAADSLHTVVVGDVRDSLEEFLSSSHEIIALAWFDMNAFAPTLSTIERIIPSLSTGAVLAFWQFNRKDLSGERRAFAEVRRLLPRHSLVTCPIYPTLACVKLEP